MLAQVVLAFLPVVITNEGCKAHIDEGGLVGHMYRDMTAVDVFRNKDDYLMAGRSTEGASTFCAEGCKFPAASLYRLRARGYSCVSDHWLCISFLAASPEELALY